MIWRSSNKEPKFFLNHFSNNWQHNSPCTLNLHLSKVNTNFSPTNAIGTIIKLEQERDKQILKYSMGTELNYAWFFWYTKKINKCFKHLKTSGLQLVFFKFQFVSVNSLFSYKKEKYFHQLTRRMVSHKAVSHSQMTKHCIKLILENMKAGTLKTAM